MTDPNAYEIIFDALARFVEGDDQEPAAHAVIGALAVGGFAIVAVDPGVARRVLSEMAKTETKR